MQGVEILDKVNLYKRTFSKLAFWITFVSTFLLELSLIFILDLGEGTIGKIGFIIFFLFFNCFASIGFGIIFGREYLSGIQYTIIIDETVDMNEFSKKYEIINAINGKIFIVRERSNE